MTKYTMTEKNVTEAQIEALRTAAGRAGDIAQCVICDIALHGTADLSDYAVDPHKVRRLSGMTRDQAMTVVVDVLNDAAGRSDVDYEGVDWTYCPQEDRDAVAAFVRGDIDAPDDDGEVTQ